MAKKSKKKKAKSKPAAKKKAPAKKAKPAAKKKISSKAKPARKKVAAKKIKPSKKIVAKKKPVAKKAKPSKKKVAKKKVVAKKVKPDKKIAAKKQKIVKEIAEKEVMPTSVLFAPRNYPEKPIKKSKVQKEEEETKLVIPNTPLMAIRKREEVAKLPAKGNALPEQANRARYSDKELDEFRKIIVKKIDEAKKELNNLTQQITNANEHGTDDTAGSFKMLEDGSESLAKEEAGQLATRQHKFIEQLENALMRIENKTYGICLVTGKLIPKERLRAVPHTTKSIEAKLNQYRD